MNDATTSHVHLMVAPAHAEPHDDDSARVQPHPSRKRGIEPAYDVPHGLTPEMTVMVDAWPARFRSKFLIGEGCWEWIAGRADGYGRYARPGHSPAVTTAHRYAYELVHGVKPASGMHVDHLCRNPSCVRPDHLEAVPPGVNVRRGAAANSAGWCRSGRHEWVTENILTESNGTRRCRPCRDERERLTRPPTGNAPGDRTHCPQGHPYDAENTSILSRGGRGCRACARAAYYRSKGQSQAKVVA